MKNLILRFLSICFILPIFILIYFYSNIYLYILSVIIFVLSIYEIFSKIKNLTFKINLSFLIIIFIYSLNSIRGTTHTEFIISIWVFSIVWLSDIGGYIVGKLFGKNKLSIHSPNKTIAGFYGSLIFSQLSFLIIFFFLPNYNINISIFIIQFLMSIVSVAGDIFFSYIKRINKIKDYSNIIPGHGGILDRIDGFIFVVILGQLLKLTNVI